MKHSRSTYAIRLPITTFILVFLGATVACAQQSSGRPQPEPIDFNDRTGWTELFDGQTLEGWDGKPGVWRVEEGAIVGEYTSPPGTRNGSTFLVWQGGEPGDFELKLEVKLEGRDADSGIQYRAYEREPAEGADPDPDAQWNILGYQYDFSFDNTLNTHIAEAGAGRGIIAFRGQVVRTEEGVRPRLISTVGTLEELGGYYRINEWNEVHLIARGNTLIHMMNGRVMAILIDQDPTKFKASGLLGLQAAGRGPVKISFRNIRLKQP